MNLILLLLPLVFLPCVFTGDKIKCWTKKGSEKDESEKFDESLYKESKKKCKWCVKTETRADDKAFFTRHCVTELPKDFLENDCKDIGAVAAESNIKRVEETRFRR